MPDPFKDEETVTRRRSLCLYNVPGITGTNNRRCDNCPGAARTPLFHQQRCPLDSLEHNLFNPAAENWKSEGNSKSLASSSRTLQHGEDTVATKTAGSTRLKRSDRASDNTDRSVSTPLFEIGVKRKAGRQPESSMRNELGADAYHDHTEEVQNAESNNLSAVSPVKRYSKIDAELMQNKRLKSFQEPLVVEDLANSLSTCSVSSPVQMQEEPHAEGDMSSEVDIELQAADILNWPENPLRTELATSVSSPKTSVHTGGNERVIVFRDGSADVEEYIRKKPQIIFQDLQEDEPLFLERSMTDAPASWSSLISFILEDNPNDMQQDHTSANSSSSGICVPGFGVMAETKGVRTCYDGIFKVNGPEKSDLLAMPDLTDEPTIDQMDF